MIRILLAAALLLPQEKPPFDGAKAAKELLDKVEAKAKGAKTVRVSFSLTAEGGLFERKGKEELFTIEALIRNPAEFRVQIVAEKKRALLRSDGKTVLSSGDEGQFDNLPKEPAELADTIRKSATLGFMAFQPESGLEVDPTPINLFFGGREKVGDVETQVVAYDVMTTQKEMGRFSIRAWIDPVKLVVLKREYDLRAFVRLTETIKKIEYDEALPADEFAFQSARSVREAVEGQIARSVELYATYRGRLPESLADLDAPPKDAEAGAFWPEGGFWIGGKRPADVKYAVADGVAKVGAKTIPAPTGGRIAPTTDRLKQVYATRVRVQLAAAAVEAWHKAYSRFPEKLEHLGAKPEGIEFWPDGGFASGDRLKDAWGDDLALTATPTTATVMIRRKDRVIRIKQLTAAESRALQLAAFPAGSPDERRALATALDRVCGDDMEGREKAAADIIAMGPRVLNGVEERLQAGTAGVGEAHLKQIREKLLVMPPSWRLELKALVATVRTVPLGHSGGTLADNEAKAVQSLKTITTAQADFRSNDRDGNRTNDFWVRDVAGLYGIEGATGTETEPKPGKDTTNIIKLIEAELAAADTTDGRWEYDCLGVAEPEPFHGYYFAALKSEERAAGATAYAGIRDDCFGYIAYPADYGVTGKRAFIVNSDNTVWKMDLKGETIETFPVAPAAHGWSKTD